MLSSALAATAAKHADAAALFFEGRTFSYRDLDAAAAAVARQLAQAGVAPGDRVGVAFANSPRLIAAVLGVLRHGAVLVPLNPAYTADELTYVAGDAQLAAAYVENAHAEILRRGAAPRVWTDVPSPRAAHGNVAKVAADAPALIIYTSGTTGHPKGAVLSHAALHTNLSSVAAAWHWTSADRLLLTLPCFHLHGLGLGILTSFLIGSSVVLRRRFVAEEILADLARQACTMFFGVPTMYNRLVALPAACERRDDLRAVRLWVSGSAPLNAATFERFRERFGYDLMDRYGMTETGFVLSTAYDEPRRPGTVGRPLPGIDVRLVDAARADAGEIIDVADGDTGELLIRGPNLFNGYWRKPLETERVMLAGYLRSGDLARRAPDGQYSILGRISVDIIKTRGFKVGAVEIEAVLQRHPAIQEVAVVGLADADQGERIVAAYTPIPGATVDAAELRELAAQHLAPHKVPADFVRVDEIPRTGPGKFKKRELIRTLQKVAAAGSVRGEIT